MRLTSTEPDGGQDVRANPGIAATVRRILGVVLLALAFLPLYRALGGTPGPGSFRTASLMLAELNLELAWWGTVVTVLAGVVLAWLLPADTIRRVVARAGSALQRPALPVLALATAVLAGGLAWLVWTLLFQGYYTNVDEIASMLHARYMAAGELAGWLPVTPAGWLIPNTLMVEEGWVSQYPPSHLAVMALLVRLGIPGLLGPLCAAVTAFLLVLALPLLLPDRPVESRVAGLLFAVSPFVLLLAGGALSHLTAGAFLVATLYTALRARDGSALWALAAGASIGLAVLSRPLQGLVLGTLFTLVLWGPGPGGSTDWAWTLRRWGATVVGGLPFAVALGWYNQRLFGHPFTLGYTAAYGAPHDLGFHVDPWGALYGPAEALGFTSTDMLAVGLRLLETPLPLTALVGLYLVLTPRLPRGGRLLLAWAILPILANAGYWFHSTRMHYEAAPAWLALSVVALVHLARPRQGLAGHEAGPGETHESVTDQIRSRLVARTPDVATWSALVAVLVAGVWGVPRILSEHRWSDETLGRISAPETPGAAEGGALVFVHAAWNERMSAVLQGEADMRADTIVSVLRRNPSCRVQRYAEARAAAVRGDAYLGPGWTAFAGEGDGTPSVDLRQEPGMAPGVAEARVPDTGVSFRVGEGEVLTPTCARQLRADRFGVVSLGPLLLRGQLPGLAEPGGTVFARDLGPRRNRAIMEAFPSRTPYLLVPPSQDSAPEALPYDEGEAHVWGVEPMSGTGSQDRAPPP